MPLGSPSPKSLLRRVGKLSLWLLLPTILLFGGIALVLFNKQEQIVQDLISTLNEDFRGEVAVAGSRLALFANFPYISIDLKQVELYEEKGRKTEPALRLGDVYAGFDLWTVLSGKLEIKKVKLSQGYIHLVQDSAGGLNLLRALEPVKEIEDVGEEFHLDLKRIELSEVLLTKTSDTDSLRVEGMIHRANARFRTDDAYVRTALKANFVVSIAFGADTSLIRNKQFALETEIDFQKDSQLLRIAPTRAKLDDVGFNLRGEIRLLEDAFLDLHFTGNKPNFDLLVAMAPDYLEPVLKRYENKGDVFFEASVVGRSIHGHSPRIEARFGCKDAYVNNFQVNKKLDEMNFTGYFTTGDGPGLETMEFGIHDFSARPEAGIFSGNLTVKNFKSPEINLQLKSDFELDFLAKFFNLEDLRDLQGKVFLTMNFRDIIDLEHPERAIEKLNEAYFSQLKVENLRFNSPAFGLPINDFDLYAEINGAEATISEFHLQAGRSDLHLTGSISDLPAIIHHTGAQVKTTLQVKSKFLDLFELTGADSTASFNEQIENLSLDIAFLCAANAFTESPNLPVGEFFIDNLYARLKNYPHTLHDFHADVLIDKADFRVIDFKGMIDKTDFLFSGTLRNYDLWFEEKPAGDTRLEFNLVSKLLQLEDIFSYQGVNYVPNDYRHEEISGLDLHGFVDLHFQDTLASIDLTLDRFFGKIKVHPLRFEQFKGRVHYEKENLMVENFSGKMGKSDFKTTLHYYLGKDEAQKKRKNHFSLVSSRLDFDELFAYNPSPAASSGASSAAAHDSVFNIYELPFTDMAFDIRIDHLNYHAYVLHGFSLAARTTPNHYIYVDDLKLQAAGGTFELKGYFNGSDPGEIYLHHELAFRQADLDKLFLKFDNFGQDYLLSENLHGRISGASSGKVRVHPDFVPILEASQVKVNVTIENGRLDNYALFDYMADYFRDKNLKRVAFDTLSNTFDFTNGMLTIPAMTINSSIGFMEISGKQDLDLNMDYTVRIPWKLVTEAAASKLFGKKNAEIDPDQEDEIQYLDRDKKTRFVSIRITGTPEDYKISLDRSKNAAKK